MAPITFALATLQQGDLDAGALMMSAMIATQVVGAVPIAAAGRRFGVSAWIRALFAFRALAYGALLLAIAGGAPISILVIAAGLAGLVNGSIFGLLRTVLNEMVTSTKLPRALGLAATANELVAVTGPIAASTIGGVSVIAAVGIMVLASIVPVVMLPRITRHVRAERTRVPREPMPLPIAMWLLAACSEGACVASIEVGAVELALRYKLAPSAALLFTVPLCVASVLGGAWISIRNRQLQQRTVVIMLILYGTGMLAMAYGALLAAAIASSVLVGVFLAPLGMSFSLFLEDLLPKSRRAEGFTLLRTSSSVGIIIASSMIAFASLETSFIVSASLAFLSVVMLGIVRPARELAD